MRKNLPRADAVVKTQRQELIRVIRNLARHSTWQIERAFERLGCSCLPQRQELEALEEEKEKKLTAAKKEIDETFDTRIEELRRGIAQIDWIEHPKLDALGRRAAHFFALWMMERIALGELGFLDEESDVRAARFAEEWFDGWRPSFPG